jgi:phosphatidate cytidylyltransferase
MRSYPNRKQLFLQSCVWSYYLDFTSEAHPHTRRETQAKPSKTAQRKAAKASRREKKLQSRSSSGGDTYEPLSPPATAPLADSETRKLSPVSKGPSSIKLSEPLPLTANASQSRAEGPPSPQNGHTTKPSEGAPRPTPPREPQNPSSVSHRAQPTTVDQPVSTVSRRLPSSSSSTKQAPPFSGPVPSSSNNVKGHATSTSSPPKADAEAEKASKKGHNVLVRTLWTFIMIGGFLGQRGTIYRATVY